MHEVCVTLFSAPMSEALVDTLPSDSLDAGLDPPAQQRRPPALRPSGTGQLGPFLTIPLLILALLFAFPGRTGAGDPFANLPVHGQPGPDKILVTVRGRVKNAGRYFVDRGETLADLEELAGGFIPCRVCQRFPEAVTLTRVHQLKGTTYYLLTESLVLATVHFNEGDDVLFWHFQL
jgi:hypothetical protein